MTSPNVVATIRTVQDRTYNIAVVDDDKADFILISRLLEYSDRGTFRLTHMASYEEAATRLEQEAFDVAFIDHFLGGKLGIDLIRQLGGRVAPCALIMLTGGGADELDLAALEAGVADYVDKNELSAQMLSRIAIYAHTRFDFERQLRRSQAQLREARDAAEAANMAKSEFLARMSDQLRTPLKSIVGFAEIIGDRSLGDSAWEQYAEYAHDIQDSGSILLEMINDILDISKIEAGKYVLKPELVDLSQVVAELSHQFEDSCAEKGIVIGHERSEEPVEAFADPRAVRQILTNLLSNAVKFTPADGRISVSVQTAPDSVTLAVADTGFGIAESDVPRILIPFE